MNAIHRLHHGHWGDRPEVDTRVSRIEQEDRQIPVDDPSWLVVLLGLSPLLVIGAVSLVFALLRT